jgi:hypothetical protein
MSIESLNMSNQDDLALAQSAISEGETKYPRHGGFTVTERSPAVPRFAPEGSITMVTAVHLLGRSLYGSNWTGEELTIDNRPEPTDEELATKALAIVTDEAIAAVGAELHFRTEPEVFQELCKKRDVELAPRRRRQAVAEKLLGFLYTGALQVVAMAGDGSAVKVPQHVWAARWAMRIFDNGGYLQVWRATFQAPAEPSPDEDITVFVDQRELENLINDAEEIIPVRPNGERAIEGVHPYKTGLPGRPRVSHLAELEFRDRLRRGVVKPTLKAEAEALIQRVKELCPKAPPLSCGATQNRIRPLHRQFREGTK